MRPLPPGHLQSLNAPKAEGASRLLWGRRGPARPWARLLATQWDQGGPGRSGRVSGSAARPAPPRVDALQFLAVHRRGRTAVSLTWPSSVSLALSAGHGVDTWPPRHSCPIPSARPPDASQIASTHGNRCPRPHPARHPGVQWILQTADLMEDQTRAAEALGSRPLGPGPLPGPGAELRPGVLNSA